MYKIAQIPFNKLKLPCNYGVCISNPPYAERMGILTMLKDFIEIWASYLTTTKLGLLTLSHLMRVLRNYMVDELIKRENFLMVM